MRWRKESLPADRGCYPSGKAAWDCGGKNGHGKNGPLLTVHAG